MISNIEVHIKNFSKNAGSEDDNKIRKNIQKKLASRLKDSMCKFRVIEENYLNSVQKIEERTDSSGLFEVEKQEEMKIERIKNEEIQKLADNFTQLAEIFKELNLLIVDQGTILDRIDYSLMMGKENTEKANVELKKAENHQKCTRATSCLLILVVLVVLLLVVLIFKHT
jgi:syntaxin 16